jgi:hypothetical protein
LTKYTILAKRETYYEFPIEADSEQEAIDKMRNIDDVADVDDYAYEYSALSIQTVEKNEVE